MSDGRWQMADRHDLVLSPLTSDLCRLTSDVRAKRVPHPHRAGHADGRSAPALLDSGAARAGGRGAGWSAGARQAAVGAAARVSRQPRTRGRDRRILRPPRGLALVRPQRGGRAALRLSRLEIRHHRTMRGGALGASRERLLQEDQAHIISLRGAGRRHLGLHGAAALAAAAARLRMERGCPLRTAS